MTTAASARRRHEKCPLCGSSVLRILIRDGDLPTPGPVLTCRECDLVFFRDMGFDENYWKKGEHVALYDEAKDTLVKEFQSYLLALRAACPQRGKLLDIGCGLGEFIGLAQTDGWRVEGVEPGERAVEVLRAKTPATIHHGYFEQLTLPVQGYDCLTMWDVIEHLYEPNAALAKAAEVLPPGGLLVFKTPNERSLFKRLPLFLYRMTGGHFKSFLKYVYYDPHYYSYSLRCCRHMLARHGFTIERVLREATDIEWARRKLDLSYSKYRVTVTLVKLLLPLAVLLARLTGRENKIIVLARKQPAAG